MKRTSKTGKLLQIIYNYILNSNHFPDLWKNAKVVTIFKSGNNNLNAKLQINICSIEFLRHL